MRYLVTLFIVSIILSCSPVKESADLLVINANVYQADDTFAKAEAFAVKDGKFIAVGTSNEIVATYEAIETIDAQGQTVLPGLIDAHCHFFGLGQNLQVVDLVGTKSYDCLLYTSPSPRD